MRLKSMRMSRAALYGAVALLTTFAVACTQVIDGADPRIAISNGRLLIEGKPFSGLLKQAIGENYEIRQTPYRDGLEHGRFTVHKKGKLIEEREFVNGQKHGTHQGWYENGKLKFISHFKTGNYTGDQFTYHDNGQVFEYKKYNGDGKLLVSKIFRQTGQIYTSQAFTAEGAAYGLPGSKLCNPVTQEKAKLKQNQSLAEKDIPL